MNDDDFPVTVFHNPTCGTSRNTVAMIEAAGYRPTVVDYLNAGWTMALLLDLSARSGLSPRQMLRENGSPAAELGLLEPDVGDMAILEAMITHPVLVNRPLVITPKGARLCRPSEVVFDLLERRPARFVKEDGEIVQGG